MQLICGDDSCWLLKAVYRVIFILGGREAAPAVGRMGGARRGGAAYGFSVADCHGFTQPHHHS